MLLTILSLINISPSLSFLLQHPSSYYRSSLILSSTSNSNSNANNNLTPLPKDISPFDKSASIGCDVQGELRKLATIAVQRALLDDDDDDDTSDKRPSRPTLLELEFPPLLGGSKSKTQFDDFDSKFIKHPILIRSYENETGVCVVLHNLTKNIFFCIFLFSCSCSLSLSLSLY